MGMNVYFVKQRSIKTGSVMTIQHLRRGGGAREVLPLRKGGGRKKF